MFKLVTQPFIKQCLQFHHFYSKRLDCISYFILGYLFQTPTLFRFFTLSRGKSPGILFDHIVANPVFMIVILTELCLIFYGHARIKSFFVNKLF